MRLKCSKSVPSLGMKTSSFLTIVCSAACLTGVSMMDWSSMCHPSEEAQATQNQLRHVGEAKLASLYQQPVDAVPAVATASSDVAELTWQVLSDVEFTDVYLEELDAYYWMPEFGPQVVLSLIHI